MQAIISQRPKSAMQSGKATSGRWTLRYEPGEAKRADPLTGWAGSGDTMAQLSLSFPTRDAAIDYATRNNIAYRVVASPEKTLKLQAYADNFR